MFKKLKMKNSRGFTLIEILVVLALIGLVLGIVAVNILGTNETVRRDGMVIELQNNVARIVQQARSANGGCAGLVTADLTAANGGQALQNTYGNAITVTAAAANSVTIQSPADTAANAAAIVGQLDPQWAPAANAANVSITYSCF